MNVAVSSESTTARPFMKWVGGKRQLLPVIESHLPPSFINYFEPFIGGGALFFHLARQWSPCGVIADANARLISTYRAVRDDVENVVRILKLYEREHLENLTIDKCGGSGNALRYYHALRAVDIDAEPCDSEVAALMIYLNRTCFNGVYRVNRRGQFNVPLGRYSNPTICDEANLRACSDVLQNTTIRCGDFEDTLSFKPPSAGDLVYFDPPYVPISKTAYFTSYTADGFGWKDQVRPRDCARRLKERSVHVLLSNSDTTAVRELYADFEIVNVSAKRAINSDASKRGSVGEVLIK